MNQPSLFDQPRTVTQKEARQRAKRVFDAADANRAKETGMTQAAAKRPDLLGEARQIARELLWGGRPDVTLDDVQRILLDRYGIENPLGNSAGSVFRHSDFTFTGAWRKSERVKGHGNPLRVWKLSTK